MTAVPDATPVTIPVVGVTVAIPVLLQVHVPPEVASLNVMVDSTQTDVFPEIDAGSGLTVISIVAVHIPPIV